MAATPFPSEIYHGNYPCANELAKTADFTITNLFNGTLFTTLGAAGAVTFTLPAISPFLVFRFRNEADQDMTVTSAEGDNLIALNDLSADSVAFSTAGQKIGAGCLVYSNGAGTKWRVVDESAGVCAITVAS